MISIDGNIGESGGQILRTALSLSAITGKPFQITNIRAKRPKPGLQAQHLTCVNAMKEICSAGVKGAQIGSSSLTFSPQAIKGGDFNFNIGTAGSITLLAQCLLPPLLLADKPSIVKFTGGTHVPFSPLADYFSGVFLPAIAKMGLVADFKVEKIGLYPRGGGKATLSVEPSADFSSISLLQRSKLEKVNVKSVVCDLSKSIAERQLAGVREKLSETVEKIEEIAEIRGCGQGTFVFISAHYENCIAGFSSLGKIGKKAEQVGAEAAQQFLEFDKSNACIDVHLADQLLLYSALAGQSNFTTEKISQHFETNAWTIKQFLDAEINWKKNGENYVVEVRETG